MRGWLPFDIWLFLHGRDFGGVRRIAKTRNYSLLLVKHRKD